MLFSERLGFKIHWKNSTAANFDIQGTKTTLLLEVQEFFNNFTRSWIPKTNSGIQISEHISKEVHWTLRAASISPS